MGVSLQQQSFSLQTATYVNRIGYDRDQKRLKRKRAGLGCRFAWTLGTMCWMAVRINWGRVNCPPNSGGASTRHLFGNGRVLQSTHAFRRTQPIARRREGRHFAAMRAVATTTVATCSRAFYKNTLPTRELQLFDE